MFSELPCADVSGSPMDSDRGSRGLAMNGDECDGCPMGGEG